MYTSISYKDVAPVVVLGVPKDNPVFGGAVILTVFREFTETFFNQLLHNSVLTSTEVELTVGQNFYTSLS